MEATQTVVRSRAGLRGAPPPAPSEESQLWHHCPPSTGRRGLRAAVAMALEPRPAAGARRGALPRPPRCSCDFQPKVLIPCLARSKSPPAVFAALGLMSSARSHAVCLMTVVTQ